MARARKLILFYILPCVLIASGAAAYEFFVGFPRVIAGRRVHRVTVWAQDSHFQPELVYYAYNSPGGEVKHGTFQRFDDGHLVQQATYREGKIDGAIVYWNLLGAKTQEVYYRAGTPYGWANFANGKLLKMRQEISRDGRTVAVETFDNNRYALEFNCGELINAAIDPASGEIASIPNATQRACVKP
jgi:hypothetical protein